VPIGPVWQTKTTLRHHLDHRAFAADTAAPVAGSAENERQIRGAFH